MPLHNKTLKYAYGQHFISYIIIIHLVYLALDIFFEIDTQMYFDLLKIILLLPIAIFTFDKNYDFSKITINFIPFYFLIVYTGVISTFKFTMICLAYFVIFPMFLIVVTNNWKIIRMVTVFIVLSIISIPFVNRFTSEFVTDKYPPSYITTFNIFTVINCIYAVFFNLYYILKINNSDNQHFLTTGTEITTKSSENNTAEKTLAVDDEKILETYQSIMNFYSENKPWKNPNFNLIDLTNELNSNTKYISLALNKIGEKNFNSFTNRYRIDEVKNSFKNKEHTLYTIKYIYSQAGFNSQTSFNRVFKQFEDVSPQEYIKMLEKDLG